MPAAPLWPQALSRYPFATALLPAWRDAAAELPDAYSAALDAALIALDTERPLAERYQQLCASRARLAELAAAGDTHIATELLRLRVLSAFGEPRAARQRCDQLLEQRERATQATPSPGERTAQPPSDHPQDQVAALRERPFLPSCAPFDDYPPEAHKGDDSGPNRDEQATDLGAWLNAMLLETHAHLNAKRRYAQPQSELARLAQRRKLPCASIEAERMLALAALRLGKKVTIKPSGQLVAESNNPRLWIRLGDASESTSSVSELDEKPITRLYVPEKDGGREESGFLGLKPITRELSISDYARKRIDSIPVAIYIPTYNMGASVAKTIHSALAQTHNNITVYCFDNASDDNTKEECAKFLDHGNFIYYQHSENIGAYENFKCLYRVSDEPWYMFLAADDLISEDYVEKCLSFSVKNHATIVGGKVQNMVNNKLYGTESAFFLESDDGFNRLLDFLKIKNSNALFYGLRYRIGLAFDDITPGSDWMDTYYHVVSGRAAVIKSTEIKRDVTKWVKNWDNDPYKSKMKMQGLVDLGYTQEMIENHKVFMSFELLYKIQQAIFKAGVYEWQPYIVAIYASSLRQKKDNQENVKKLTDFLKNIYFVAKSSNYFHIQKIQRFVRDFVSWLQEKGFECR
ncbi:glycosyltransferase family 2 protein [Halochromatium salexigens]|nr:glycosyltransferase family 2 protein [Halochromatium salexigens]